MLKLFIITLSLLFAAPTFAMHTIKSRLTQSIQRRYATMTKEDFTKLLDYKKSPEQFASDLTMIKADKDDLIKLQTDLNKQIQNLRPTIDKPSLFKSTVGSLTLIGLIMCSPANSGLGIILLGAWILADESDKDKKFEKDNAKLKHLASLITDNTE